MRKVYLLEPGDVIRKDDMVLDGIYWYYVEDRFNNMINDIYKPSFPFMFRDVEESDNE